MFCSLMLRTRRWYLLLCALLLPRKGRWRESYRGYSKLITHTALGSYSRPMHSSIGPP